MPDAMMHAMQVITANTRQSGARWTVGEIIEDSGEIAIISPSHVVIGHADKRRTRRPACRLPMTHILPVERSEFDSFQERHGWRTRDSVPSF